MKNRLITAVFLAALTLAGCGELATSAPAPPELSPVSAEFQDAGSEVDLAGTTWRAEMRVWRNVQPHAGGGGVPRCANLCAKVTVTAIDGEPRTDVTVRGVWALPEGGMAAFEDFDVEETDQGLEVTAERGPRTDTGTAVAVVVELAAEGTSVLVRTPVVEVGPEA